MKIVYREQLPESYLLVLGPGTAGEPEEALAHWLNCARTSGKPAVWVDCGMLSSLSDEAAALLLASHYQLQQVHSHLVLVHVPQRVAKELLERAPGAVPCIVPTLLDAAQQAHWPEAA